MQVLITVNNTYLNEKILQQRKRICREIRMGA